jgi:hypothetical protein
MGRKKLDSETYKMRIERRFGPRILDQFNSVFTGDMSLADIARIHRISKMRVSQMFKRIYGKTYREMRKDGHVMSDDGTVYAYSPGEKKTFMVILPANIHAMLKEYSKEVNMSMSRIVRDRITSMFYKTDTLSNLERLKEDMF